MKVFGFDVHEGELPPSSEQLATAWWPYIETCIEAFGPSRAMFESNFPSTKVRTATVSSGMPASGWRKGRAPPRRPICFTGRRRVSTGLVLEGPEMKVHPAWRSLLFVPVLSERFLAKAHARGANAIILDLEEFRSCP